MNFIIRAIRFLEYYKLIVLAITLLVFIGFIVCKIRNFINRKRESNEEITTFAYFANNITKHLDPFFSFVLLAVLIVSLPISLITNSAFQELIGLHNLYLENDGNYCYSVEIYEYESKDRYLVPAEIEIDGGTWYLKKYVLPDGRVIKAIEENEISLQDHTFAFDDEGNDWADIKLLNEHTVSEKIIESNRINVITITSLLLAIICIPFSIMVLKKGRERFTTTNAPTEQVK